MRDLTTVVCSAYSTLNNISKRPFPHDLVIEKNTRIFFVAKNTKKLGIPSLNGRASGNSEKCQVDTVAIQPPQKMFLHSREAIPEKFCIQHEV